MTELETDIYNTQNLINGREKKGFSPVYFSTNEMLDDILQYIDVQGKKILSVIGSGDQAFHFYNMGARKVDLFDINKLTFYYYYLRVWTMRYLKKSYPEYNMDTNYIRNLLELVTPKSADEIKAYKYWMKFVNNFNVVCSDFMFIPSFLDLDEKIYDGTDLFERIAEYDPKFYHFDITERINHKSKYDIIYTSNIHEYIEKEEKFKLYRNNLFKLSKRNGIIISTNVMNDGPYEEEIKCMKKKFKCRHLPNIDFDYGIGITSLGYCYSKRKIHL